jgi:lysozyme family protein
MADFMQSFWETKTAEGVYSNNPKDSGGETLYGIARNFWYKTAPDGPWVKIRGPEISSQWIADELFDTATNAYHITAAEFLQRILNVLNRSDLAGGTLWEELEIKGGIGPKTLGALRTALDRGFGPDIYVYLNCLQGAFYIRIAELDPTKEAFVRGWRKRISGRDISKFE